MVSAMDYTRPLGGEEKQVRSRDGAMLSSVALGSGQPVVLAHGYASEKNHWNVLAEALLARNFQVIAFDQRGHGRSGIGTEGIGSAAMAADYLAVLEAHHVQQGVLVGHSMGGFLAIRAMIESREAMARHLRGCLLMATFAGDVNRRNMQNQLQIFLIRMGLMDMLIRHDGFAMNLAKTLLGEEKNLGMMRAMRDGFRGSDLKILLPILNAFVRENRYASLKDIELPCTIVVGEKDKTTPPFHTDELHAGIRGSRLRRIPGKGHMLNWEAPEVLVEEIVRLAS